MRGLSDCRLICGGFNEIDVFSLTPPHFLNLYHLTGHWGEICTLSLNCHGILAAATRGKSILLLDNRPNGFYRVTQQYQYPVLEQEKDFYQLKWSLDGNYLYLVARFISRIDVVDIRKFPEVAFSLAGEFRATDRPVWTELSPDGQYFFNGSTNGEVRLWSIPRLFQQGLAHIAYLPHSTFFAHDGMHPNCISNRRMRDFPESPSLCASVSHDFSQ